MYFDFFLTELAAILKAYHICMALHNAHMHCITVTVTSYNVHLICVIIILFVSASSGLFFKCNVWILIQLKLARAQHSAEEDTCSVHLCNQWVTASLRSQTGYFWWVVVHVTLVCLHGQSELQTCIYVCRLVVAEQNHIHYAGQAQDTSTLWA